MVTVEYFSNAKTFLKENVICECGCELAQLKTLRLVLRWSNNMRKQERKEKRGINNWRCQSSWD